MSPAWIRPFRVPVRRAGLPLPAARWPLLAVLLLVGATGCSDDPPSDEVTVFAAASLADVMAAAAEAFTDETGIAVRLNVAGSSALRLQLDEGARADVYVPADPAQIDLLDAPPEAPPSMIASNELVVAYRADGTRVALSDFDRDELLLGACAPQVPCGRYAALAFEAAALTPALDTEETDVRSLSSKVADGDLDAGVVYATDVVADDRLAASPLPDAVRSTLSIVYVAAPLDGGAAPELRDRFIDFLTSDAAQAVFREAGFGTR